MVHADLSVPAGCNLQNVRHVQLHLGLADSHHRHSGVGLHLLANLRHREQGFRQDHRKGGRLGLGFLPHRNLFPCDVGVGHLSRGPVDGHALRCHAVVARLRQAALVARIWRAVVDWRHDQPVAAFGPAHPGAVGHLASDLPLATPGHAAKLAARLPRSSSRIAPWTIRNYVVFHKFIPLRSNFGLELWLGNNPAVPDTWSPFLHPNDNPSRKPAKYVRMTEIPYMAEKQQLAIEFMRTHPSDAARFVFHRFAETWMGMWDSPLPTSGATSPLYVKSIIVWNCLFSLLALLGVLFAYRARKEAALPFAMVMLFFPLIFYVTHPAQRYRYPMDPIMQVLAVYAIVYPLSHFSAEFRGPGIPAALRKCPRQRLGLDTWPQIETARVAAPVIPKRSDCLS